MTPEERRRLEGLLEDAAREAPPASLRRRIFGVTGRRRFRRVRFEAMSEGPWLWAAWAGAAALAFLLGVVWIARGGPRDRSEVPGGSALVGARERHGGEEAPASAARGSGTPRAAEPDRPPAPPSLRAESATEGPRAADLEHPMGRPAPESPRGDSDRSPGVPADRLPPRPAARPPTIEVPPVVVLEASSGEVTRDDGTSARPGPLAEGVGLRTGLGAHARLAFPDGSILEIGASSRVSALSGGGPLRLELQSGILEATVPSQKDRIPFALQTPEVRLSVLGTRFRVRATAGSTRVSVTEGSVQVVRRSDGAGLVVPAGKYMVARPAGEWGAWPLPPEEIVLGASQARLVGGEWRRVRDPEAFDGNALQTNRADIKPGGLQSRRSFAIFQFHAEPDREYSVWVRGKCLETRQAPYEHDAVALVVRGGSFSKECTDPKVRGREAYLFNGFGEEPAADGTLSYVWIGGNGTADGVRIRFDRPGLQTLELHAIESPVRIDTIWISATRTVRPAAEQRPGP